MTELEQDPSDLDVVGEEWGELLPCGTPLFGIAGWGFPTSLRDRAVNDLLDLADLAWIAVLTFSSLQLWVAAHAALHRPGGLDAAAVLGVDPANALRTLTGAIGRAYKPAA